MKEYLIADLHLGHKAIIEYCNRPFGTVEEMNHEIVRRWNDTVSPEDFVYYLGDICLDNNDDYWLCQLNGHICFIKGNHDKRRRGLNFGMKLYGEKRFILVHSPSTANMWHWKDWVIHGHTHDNAAHIDVKNKCISVSAEVLNYKPLSFIDLLDELEDNKDMDVCEKHFNIIRR